MSAPTPRQGVLPPAKLTPSIIQAAPTVYSTPPAPFGHKRNDVRAQRQVRMVLAFLVSSATSVMICAALIVQRRGAVVIMNLTGLSGGAGSTGCRAAGSSDCCRSSGEEGR